MRWCLDRFRLHGGIKELTDLLPDKLLAFGRLPPDLLLHRVCVRSHSQVVLNHLPRDPGHVGWPPCKHVGVSPEEGDECAFLFAAQVTANLDDLGGVFAHHDLLRRNGGVGSEVRTAAAGGGGGERT